LVTSPADLVSFFALNIAVKFDTRVYKVMGGGATIMAAMAMATTAVAITIPLSAALSPLMALAITVFALCCLASRLQ